MNFAQQLALVGPVLLFSMVAHEYAHGYAAYRQGDMTAYQLGRLTWNPLKHIDPFMTVLLPVFLAFVGGPIFGGAKPVPVNPRNYRHYKRGDIIVSLAGVATNVVIAVLFAGAVYAQTVVGVIGFLAMLVSAYFFVTAWRKGLGGSDEPAAPKTAKPSSGGSFVDRMEERWQRRQDGDDR